MRRPRLAVALAALGLLALRVAAGVALPRFYEVALASTEIENANPHVTIEAQADAGSAAAETVTLGNPLWAIPISKLPATRDRPLFSVSRRPPPPAVAAAVEQPPTAVAKPAAPQTPPFTLVGTIIGEQNRIAIFFDEASKSATRLKEGERASGWTLRSVDPRSAVLEGGGHMVTLDLPEPAAKDSPPPRVSGVARKRGFMRDNPNGL